MFCCWKPRYLYEKLDKVESQLEAITNNVDELKVDVSNLNIAGSSSNIRNGDKVDEPARAKINKIIKSSTTKNTPKFDFSLDYKGPAKIIKCYDGDTCTISFEYNGEVVYSSLRLLGYDTAERGHRATSDAEKEAGESGRDYFISLNGFTEEEHDKLVYVHLFGLDMYGRILGLMYDKKPNKKTKSLNQLMIESGHGIPYNKDKMKLKKMDFLVWDKMSSAERDVVIEQQCHSYDWWV